MPTTDGPIIFGLLTDPSTVPDWDRVVTKQILHDSGNPTCLISRTVSSPESEATAIYDNCVRHGVAAQLALYLAPGQAVVRVCAASIAAGESRAIGVSKATTEVYAQGASNVSHHCLSAEERKTKCVKDIAFSSLAAPENFFVIAKAHPQVVKVLDETKTNGCVHVETRPPDAPAESVTPSGAVVSGEPNFSPGVP